MKILEFTPHDKKMLKKMLKFHKNLYKNEPNWMPPLNVDLMGSKLLGIKGLLRHDHPFHSHADVKYFLAVNENNEVQGSIAATVNYAHNEFAHEKTGFFGFFEVVEDYEVAKALLDKASEWLKSQNMDTVRGPASFSSNDPWGLLIENFEDLPYMFTTYNFPYYQGFIEKYGFEKKKDLLAELLPVKMGGEADEQKRMDRMVRVSEKIQKRFNVTLESFNKKKPERHLAEIKSLYNEAWKDNWGFVPLNDAEYDILAENLKMAADPDVVKIAYVDGKPAAFIGTLPDINEVLDKSRKMPEIFKLLRIMWWLKRKKFTRNRLLLFGIKEEHRMKGLDAVIFLDEFICAQNSSYTHCEISWLLEDNTLVIQAGERLNAKVYKKWRIYDKAL